MGVAQITRSRDRNFFVSHCFIKLFWIASIWHGDRCAGSRSARGHGARADSHRIARWAATPGFGINCLAISEESADFSGHLTASNSAVVRKIETADDSSCDSRLAEDSRRSVSQVQTANCRKPDSAGWKWNAEFQGIPGKRNVLRESNPAERCLWKRVGITTHYSGLERVTAERRRSRTGQRWRRRRDSNPR
jgi:hypothetical protein